MESLQLTPYDCWRIKRIENLETLTKLDVLDLHGNQVNITKCNFRLWDDARAKIATMIMFTFCHMQWTVESFFVFGTVSVWFFVCVWHILGTIEQIYAKFTQQTCLILCSDEFEGQGHQGQNIAFLALLAACMRIMFGKTSLASSRK